MNTATSKYLRAVLSLVMTGHKGQVRDDGMFYHHHPISVARRLMVWGITDNAVLATALCHDLLEDTSITEDQIREVAGSEVLEAVIQLTKVSLGNKADGSKHTYEEKHEAFLAQVREYGPIAVRVKIADRYDNLSSALGSWEGYRIKRYAKAGLDILNNVREIPLDFDMRADEARAFFWRLSQDSLVLDI